MKNDSLKKYHALSDEEKAEAQKKNREELEAGLEEHQVKYVQSIPNNFQLLYLKACNNSKASALKFKCVECANFSPSEVTACSVNTCALWVYRPYQNRDISNLD